MKAAQDQAFRKLDALKSTQLLVDNESLKSLVDSTPSSWTQALRVHRDVVLDYKKVIAICPQEQLDKSEVFGQIGGALKMTEAEIIENFRVVFCKEVVHCVGELATHLQDTEANIEVLTVEATKRLMKVSLNLTVLDVKGCFVDDAAENSQVQIQQDRVAFVKELCLGFTACWKYSLRYRVAFNPAALQASPPQPQPLFGYMMVSRIGDIHSQSQLVAFRRSIHGQSMDIHELKIHGYPLPSHGQPEHVFFKFWMPFPISASQNSQLASYIR